jgi:branched-chain amino acid transport system substrate-binding protein
LDFSAELSKARAANPEAIFTFYPGAAGIQFLTQYTQAGMKDRFPLYTVFVTDELTLPQQKDMAVGVPSIMEWVNDLPNDTNKQFVTSFKAKYNTSPSPYGAESYDAVALINSAVSGVGGDLSKKEEMRKQMEKADFKSVRGKFRYGNNHMPIQDFYLQTVVKNPDGSFSMKTVTKVVEDAQDRYHDKCPMK